jgi:hypothetical protein
MLYLSRSGAFSKDLDNYGPALDFASMEKVSGATANLTSKFKVSVSDDLVQGQDPPVLQENHVYGP